METIIREHKVISNNVVPKPVVGQFKSIGRASWKWWQVVGELIDNTITVDRNTEVSMILDTFTKEFTIKDNSIGIPGKDLEDVISLGKKVNQGKQLLFF